MAINPGVYQSGSPAVRQFVRCAAACIPHFLLVSILTLVACKQTPEQTDSLPADSAYYQEPYRPRFHFSPEKMWMNDPNGMVFFEGEYHLFYQYYPDSTVWGPMHWGHAVSRDLLHWEHLPIALYPDSLGLIFSGSAVVDWKNTSGFGRDGQPPLVAIFTQHLMEGEKAGRKDFQYQSIAYSNDKGRTWMKYAGNPVIPNPGIKDFRDPKVIWDEGSGQWVMVFAAGDHVKLYGSKDLKEWEHLSDFGREWGVHAGVWECPDLFPLTVEGTGRKKWVLLLSINPGAANGGSGTQYFVGDFDGKVFELDPEFARAVDGEKAVWLDYGRDNYAGVTWSDIPAADGRRIFMGWMSNWDYAQVTPTGIWRSAMTLPRVLTLAGTSAGLRLASQPAKELEQLRKTEKNLDLGEFSGEKDLTAELPFADGWMEMECSFQLAPGEKPVFSIVLANSRGETYRIGLDRAKNAWFSDRRQSGKTDFSPAFAKDIHYAPAPDENSNVVMRVYFDAGSAELFAADGRINITDLFFPNEDFNRISLKAEGGKVAGLQVKGYSLKSVWEK